MTKKLTFLSFLGDKDRHNPLSVAVQVDITPWIIIPLVNMKGFLFPSSHSASSTALEDWDRAWSVGWEHDINIVLIVGNLMWKVDWNIDSVPPVPGWDRKLLTDFNVTLSSPRSLSISSVSVSVIDIFCWCQVARDSKTPCKPIRKFPERMFVRNISWKLFWLSLSYQKYERDLLLSNERHKLFG